MDAGFIFSNDPANNYNSIYRLFKKIVSSCVEINSSSASILDKESLLKSNPDPTHSLIAFIINPWNNFC